MSSQDIAIAVGSAGSATGLGALRSLAAWDPPLALCACDSNPSHLIAAASEFDFVQIPAANSEGFAKTLAATLAQKRMSAFYPIHDAEVAEAVANLSIFTDHGIAVLAPDHAAVAIVRDKLSMAAVFEDAGVPVPSTTRLDQTQWDGAPIHIKPRTGVGSHGVGLISDADTLAKRQKADDAEQLIAQPYIEGQEVTIDAFCPTPGKVMVYACRERVEVKAGVSTKARIFQDSELHTLTARVSAALGLTGSFCYQVRGAPDTGWQVIDVNPRVGGGTPLSAAAGLDFASAHVAHFLGMDPAPYFRALPDGDVFVVRSFREHVTWPQKL